MCAQAQTSSHDSHTQASIEHIVEGIHTLLDLLISGYRLLRVVRRDTGFQDTCTRPFKRCVATRVSEDG